MCYEERYYSEWAERAARRRREEAQRTATRTEEPKPTEVRPERRPATVPEREPVTEIV
jgi:hypothetical protein